MKKKKIKKEVKSIEDYRLTEEDRKNIVTPQQLQALGEYRRKKKLENKIARVNKYKEIIKNNEDYLLNYIEDIVINFDGKILQEVQFKHNICKLIRRILENEGIDIKSIKKSFFTNIYISGDYWNIYLEKIENLVNDTDKNQSENYSIARERKKDKRKKDLTHILSVTKTKSPRKYGKLSDSDLENYKLDYLFYTTDSENTLPNKEQCGEKVNVEEIKKMIDIFKK